MGYLYGKLTIERKSLLPSGIRTYSTNTLNSRYDELMISALGLMSASEKSFFDIDGNHYNILDVVRLYENDPIAVEVNTTSSIAGAVRAILERWSRLKGANEFVLIENSSESDFGFGAFVTPSTGDNSMTDFRPKEVDLPIFNGMDDEFDWRKDNPLTLKESPEGVHINPEHSIPKGDIWDMVFTYDVGTERIPYRKTYFPIYAQNIYTNTYFNTERYYENNDGSTRSYIIDSTPSISLKSTIRNRGSTRNYEKSVSVTAAQIIGAGYSSDKGAVEQLSLVKQLQDAQYVQRSNLDASYKAGSVQRKKMSGSSGFSQMAGGPLNVSLDRTKIAPALQQSIVSPNDSLVTVPSAAGGKQGVLLQQTIPLTDAGILGNQTTNFQAEQLFGKVATFITAAGDAQKLNPEDLQQGTFTYSGKVQLYNVVKKNMSTKKASLTVSNFTDDPADVPTYSVQTYSQNNKIFSGNQTLLEGSMGTEDFEELGYNGWSVGDGTFMFTMTLDEDTGYDSFDPGTLFPSGDTETFDDGWAVGFSPYSRRGESVEFEDDLSSQCNGSKSKFKTTYPYVRGTLQIAWQGQVQVVGSTFTEEDNKSFSTTFVPSDGDYLTAKYNRFYGTSDPGGFAQTTTEQLQDMLRRKLNSGSDD